MAGKKKQKMGMPHGGMKQDSKPEKIPPPSANASKVKGRRTKKTKV